MSNKSKQANAITSVSALTDDPRGLDACLLGEGEGGERIFVLEQELGNRKP